LSQLRKMLGGFWNTHEIGVAAQRARHELRVFAADLAVSIARWAMHIDERTDQNLIRAFVKELGRPDEAAQTNPEPLIRAIAYV